MAQTQVKPKPRPRPAGSSIDLRTPSGRLLPF